MAFVTVERLEDGRVKVSTPDGSDSVTASVADLLNVIEELERKVVKR